MGMDYPTLVEVLRRIWPPMYAESERTGEPFSTGYDGGVITYHPTTCKCGDCLNRKAMP